MTPKQVDEAITRIIDAAHECGVEGIHNDPFLITLRNELRRAARLGRIDREDLKPLNGEHPK